MTAPAPRRVPAPPGYEPGACRRCRRPIFWATLVNLVGDVVRHADTRKAKRLPLDREPTLEGVLRLVEGGRGRARFITGQEAAIRRGQDDPEPLYHVHDCPARPRRPR